MVQASDDQLPITEQVSLGGADFGRGFTTALVTGDSGWRFGVGLSTRF